jgi:hypothetical protein
VKRALTIIIIGLLSINIFAETMSNASIITMLDHQGLIETNGLIYARAEEEIDSSRSPDEGIKAAILKAKEKILQYKGEKLSSLFLSERLFDNLKENEIFQNSVSSQSEGYITGFAVLKNTKKFISGNEFTRVTVYVRAKYEKIKGDKDPRFDMKIKINKRIFLNGENMVLQVRSSLKGYLTIFCIDENGKARMLFPNFINTNNVIFANSPFNLPTQKETDATASYRTYLTEGHDESLEFLRVIITAEPFSPLNIENIDDFPGQFVKIERDKIEYIDVGYKIVAK